MNKLITAVLMFLPVSQFSRIPGMYFLCWAMVSMMQNNSIHSMWILLVWLDKVKPRWGRGRVNLPLFCHLGKMEGARRSEEESIPHCIACVFQPWHYWGTNLPGSAPPHGPYSSLPQSSNAPLFLSQPSPRPLVPRRQTVAVQGLKGLHRLPLRPKKSTHGGEREFICLSH